MILDDSIGVLYTHCGEGLCEVGNRHCLDAQYVVGVEKSLEVFCSQEWPLWEGVD